jgi:hypothetical protein
MSNQITISATELESIKAAAHQAGRDELQKEYSEMEAVGFHDAKYKDWSHVERIGWDAVIIRPNPPQSTDERKSHE